MKCQKLTSSSARWCTQCRCTLGFRECSNGHYNRLAAKCCGQCGSTKLTQGVNVLRLRPLTWLATIGLAALTIPKALGSLHGLSVAMFRSFASLVFPAIVSLAMIHLIAYPFLTEKGRANFSQVWMSMFSTGILAIKVILNLLLFLSKRK